MRPVSHVNPSRLCPRLPTAPTPFPCLIQPPLKCTSSLSALPQSQGTIGCRRKQSFQLQWRGICETEQRRRARRDWTGTQVWVPGGLSSSPLCPRCACPYQPFGEWPVPGRYTKPAHRHCITPTSLLPPLDWPLGQIASICFLSSPILRDIWGGEDILGWSSIVHLQLPLCSTPHSPNNSHTVAHPATYFPPKLSFRCYLRQILSFHLFIKGSICLLESCGGLCNHL